MQAKRILVVEDQKIIALNIEKTLLSLGYDVTAAVSSGAEAIQKAEDTNPDLVLMDIVLQGDQNGLEIAQQIRDRFDIPVIYLSAYADDNILQRAKLTEPFGFILKPFKQEELRFAIEIAIHKHKLEKKITETASWLNSTLKSIGDAIITIDLNSIVTFMNPAAERLTGWKRKDALGRDLEQVLKIERRYLKQFENSLFNSMSEGIVAELKKYSIIAKDEQVIPVSDTVSPIKNEEGSIIGAVLIFSKPSEWNRSIVTRDKDVEKIISKTNRQISPISIVVASPSHLVQEGIRKIVEPESDITIVAEASSLLEILLLVRQKRPDILCIDTSLPDLDILKIQQSINEDNIDTKILLLLHRLDDVFIIKALYLGVDGYLKNTSTPEVLLRAIRAINNDEIWAERDILTKMLRRFTGSRNNNLALLMSKLTSREKEIFKLLTQGYSNKQIAQELEISRNTVRNHVSNIFDKIGISNRLHVEFDLICDDSK